MSTIPQQLPFSNPENIVSAATGTIFRRDGERFSLEYRGTITELSLSKKSFANNYRNEVWMDSLNEETISFSKARESWIKTGTTTGKTGWRYISDKNQSLQAEPLATSTYIVGVDDEKYTAGVAKSYKLLVYFTGSYYSGSNTFKVQISSSSPSWKFENSLLRFPIVGSLSGSPTALTSLTSSGLFAWTSSVATASNFGFTASLRYDGVTGSADESQTDIQIKMFLSSGFGGSETQVNGPATFTLLRA
jgi:hypothetical protein